MFNWSAEGIQKLYLSDNQQLKLANGLGIYLQFGLNIQL